jgi:hypothetical protein
MVRMIPQRLHLSPDDGGRYHLEQFLSIVRAALATMLAGLTFVLGSIGRRVKEQRCVVALFPKAVKQNITLS